MEIGLWLSLFVTLSFPPILIIIYSILSLNAYSLLPKLGLICGEATGNEIMFQTVSQLWKELQGMDCDISNIRVNG